MAVFTGEVKGYFEIWVHKGNQEDKGGMGNTMLKVNLRVFLFVLFLGFFFVVFCAHRLHYNGTAQDSLFH